MTREEIEKDRQYQLTGAAIDYCRKELPHYDGEALGEIVGKKEKEELTNLDVEIGYEIHPKSSKSPTPRIWGICRNRAGTSI